MNEQNTPSIQSDEQARKQGQTPVDIWLAKIRKARADEKAWREVAQEAIDTFEAGEKASTAFNIFHSNIETIVPALYNSTPTPDVRRRYADEDPIARMGSELIERGITCTLDKYDFDEVMFGAVQDAVLPGRGTSRIRYSVETSPVELEEGDDPGGDSHEVVSEQSTWSEPVPWDRYLQGPGLLWKDVPWVGFDHDLTRDDVERLVKEQELPEGVETVEKWIDELGFTDGEHVDNDGDKEEKDTGQGVYQTIKVYEIWSKPDRKVYWITDRDTKRPLRTDDDPLELSNFFPVPAPLQQIKRAGSLKPQCAFAIYKPLLVEIDDTTKRIKGLVKQLRVRGVADPSFADVLEKLSMALDGEYVTGGESDEFRSGVKIEDFIHHFPMDPTIKALAQLYQQREQAKQALYEVSGLSDILRGQSKASETATAQDIKARWGSQRIQRLQGEVARFARDLFRLKAEVIMNLFEWEHIKEVTQMPFDVAKAPGKIGHNGGPELEDDDAQMSEDDAEEAVRDLFQSKGRMYRIDIESDSTIRADFQRNQEQMNLFLNGTAQFMQAYGGLKQFAPEAAPAFMKLYATTFARQFNMGKTAEDALEALSDMSGQSEEEDPRLMEAQQVIEQLEQQMQEMARQVEDKTAEREHQLALKDRELQQRQAEHEVTVNAQREKTHIEAEFKERELDLKSQDVEVARARLTVEDKRAAMPFHIEQMRQDFESQHRERDREIKQAEIVSRERVEKQRAAKAARHRQKSTKEPA